MGKRSCDLAGHCNTLTFWMRKMFWVCLAMCGRVLSWKIPTLLQIRYNNRLDNSVTVPLSSEITRYYDEICLPIMMYARPNHHATTPIMITFDDVILVQPLPPCPPNSNCVISKCHLICPETERCAIACESSPDEPCPIGVLFHGVTRSAECQWRDGTLSIKRRVTYY